MSILIILMRLQVRAATYITTYLHPIFQQMCEKVLKQSPNSCFYARKSLVAAGVRHELDVYFLFRIFLTDDAALSSLMASALEISQTITHLLLATR